MWPPLRWQNSYKSLLGSGKKAALTCIQWMSQHKNYTNFLASVPPEVHEDHRVHTERQWPISGVHSIMMEKSALAGGGGSAHPPLSLYLHYHHIQSCSVRSRGQIHSQYFISTLYEICVHDDKSCLFCKQFKAVLIGILYSTTCQFLCAMTQ